MPIANNQQPKPKRDTSKDIYNHVQGKLYNPTVSHDIKQNITRGRPPATNKGHEMFIQAQQTFDQAHSFKPAINKDYKG
jgi:hypothetical protein